MRRSLKLAEVLPVLYLRGLSTGDFQQALPSLLGEEASAGLSSTTITRLLACLQQDYEVFRKRSFECKRFAYLFADGVHFRVRLEEDRLCTLVLIGVREDGSKELVAVEDGYRESSESWLSVLRDLQRRGLEAPLLAIGDGALGFWKALREVWPKAAEQRCWVHRTANVLDRLPKRLQPRAKKHLHEIFQAETKRIAEEQVEMFQREYGDRYPWPINCSPWPRSDGERSEARISLPSYWPARSSLTDGPNGSRIRKNALLDQTPIPNNRSYRLDAIHRGSVRSSTQGKTPW